MRRRTLLAGVGAGLTAGCLGRVGYRGRQSPAGGSAYRIVDLETSSATERPSVRYVLEPRAFYSEDAVQRKRDREGEVRVTDVSNLDPPVREAVETAIRDGEWRADALPDGLAETVERYDFFTGASSGTHTHVGLELYRLDPDAPPAVAFEAAVPDDRAAPGDPGAIEFALRNVGDEPREVFSGTVPPFGVVFAEAVGGAGRFLLWRDYREEGCVFFTDEGVGQCDIGKITELRPGEELARRYEVLHDSTTVRPEYTRPPGPGAYRVTDRVGHSRKMGAPGSTLSFEVQFTLERE